MTWYFDDTLERLHAIDTTRHEAHEQLRQLEGRLVFDVFVCSKMPSFPDDLRQAIFQAVVNHGVETRPEALPPLDLPDIAAHVLRCGRLCDEIHTVFHDVCQRQIWGFSDSPLAPVQTLNAAAADELENLVRKAQEADNANPHKAKSR